MDYVIISPRFQDVAALESQPLLGFFLREEKNGPAQKLQFKLYHKNTLFYIFKADDIPTAQRYLHGNGRRGAGPQNSVGAAAFNKDVGQ